MARRHSIAPPRKNTDHRGVIAKARGRAEDWENGVGVVAPLDLDSSLDRPGMDLEAWAVYTTAAAYWSAGHGEIRLGALARSAGLPKKAVEGALRRAGGQALADGAELSAKRLPKRVAFIYGLDDGIVRLHRALTAWRDQGIYVLMPVDVVRSAPSAPALRLLIATKGVAVRRDENALRSWPRETLRDMLGLPPKADIETVLADAIPWVRENLRTDRSVAIELDDGWLRVAAGPAEHTIASLLADGFDPLAHRARYAGKDVLRGMAVFDGPADGKRMVLPGLWVHRAVDYLARVGASVTPEQLRGQWLVHAHAARQGVSTPLAIQADLSTGVRASFSAFVGAVARVAAEGKTWNLSRADVELAEAARLRRWLLRDGSTNHVHAWATDGRVMTAAMWWKHVRSFSSARLRTEQASLWHVDQPLPPDLPMPAIGTGVLVDADLIVPAPSSRPMGFERVDAADIERALARMVSEDSGEMDRALARLAGAYARDLADAPSRLLKVVLRNGYLPHRGLAQMVLEDGSRYEGDVSALWQDAADAMACEGHGDDREDVLRRASTLLGEALRQAQEAVLAEKAMRTALREEMLSRASEPLVPNPTAPAVIEAPTEEPVPAAGSPRPRPSIRRPFAAPVARKSTAATPAEETITTEPPAETKVSLTAAHLAPGETLVQLHEALASLPRGRATNDPDRSVASFYLPALAAELEVDGRIAENLRFRLLVGVDELVDSLRRPEGIERVEFEAAVSAAADVLRDIGLGADSTARLRGNLAFVVARQLTRTLEAFGLRLGASQAVATDEVA